ncbi:winged helix-turn-helix transcriptional regulator [Agreia pratensis]|uniref:Transcriptional regulator, ArsR family n=1 Tax=Agreia pratensis TaxID=150121 RepID=A0A1X7KS95_9MICO|nr:winged helix-turn-helix domain-containing protein [Agreia pratensis]MBF4635764.1 winged helix-turn-helix transcriptional regulator [Agreia pratensis]SMG44405.1 transcriptional regulator, ArsR family [Agreia pratensis]
MSGEPDIAVPARALGDPARGRIVTALLGGRSIPAGDLARAAGVSASTASEHLRVLLAAGLVAVDHRGRHRFFRLASSEVAGAIEALQEIAPRTEIRSLRQHHVSEELRSARTCYDHLAGDLGLRMADLLVSSGVVSELKIGESSSAPEPFPAGQLVHALRIRPTQGRRPWARGCLDWTGRRAHVAGQVGAQIFSAMDAQGWVARRADSRAVRLTGRGAALLSELEQVTNELV